MKLTNNSEIYDEYILARDQLEEFVNTNKKYVQEFAYVDFLDFRFETENIFSNLNLVYFENRINRLHNENPDDRTLKQANDILLDFIPSYIERNSKKIEVLKEKKNSKNNSS